MTKIQGICEYCGVGHGEFTCPSPRRKVVEAAAALEEALAAEALAKAGITPETIQAKIQEVAAEIPPDPAVEAESEELLPVTQAAKVPAPPTAPVHVLPLPLTVTRVTSEMAEFSDGTAVLRQRPMHAKIKIPPMMTPDRFRFVFQVGDAIEECRGKLQSDGPAQVG